jgi:hypothetical protein
MVMTVSTENFAPQIQQAIDRLVRQGWFRDVNSLLEEAVRRYVESHSEELTNRFAEEDIQWGLHGSE